MRGSRCSPVWLQAGGQGSFCREHRVLQLWPGLHPERSWGAHLPEGRKEGLGQPPSTLCWWVWSFWIWLEIFEVWSFETAKTLANWVLCLDLHCIFISLFCFVLFNPGFWHLNMLNSTVAYMNNYVLQCKNKITKAEKTAFCQTLLMHTRCPLVSVPLCTRHSNDGHREIS